MPVRKLDTTDATILLVLVCGLVSLAILSYLIIAPYLVENTFLPANCTVLEVRQERLRPDATVSDRCVVVRVRYSGHDEEDELLTEQNGTLHISTDFLNSQCSCNICESLGEAGVEGNLVPCFFNPDQTSQLIARRQHTFWATVHSALWPSIIVLGAVSVFLARRCSPDIEE